MKELIHEGSRIDTLLGHLIVTSYNGSIVYCDYYEFQDNESYSKEFRMLTLNEIGHAMKEVDGKNHKVYWDYDYES